MAPYRPPLGRIADAAPPSSPSTGCPVARALLPRVQRGAALLDPVALRGDVHLVPG